MELAEALRQPAQLQMTLGTRALFALLDGRFEAAEALIDESVTLGERTWIASLLSPAWSSGCSDGNQGRLPRSRR